MGIYLIAHDLGTSGDKASLFSSEGKLVGSCTMPYGVHFFGENCAEQDPEDWWKAVVKATRRILDGVNPGEIAAVSFSSQMQACVAVDREGHALRPALIWADMRAVVQEERLRDRIGEEKMNRITGHRPSAAYSLEKLMWIRDNEPEIYEKTWKMLLAKDYIICRLTGEFVTDYSEASGTDAFDLRNQEWSEEILSAAAIDRGKFPELHASTDVIGSLREDEAGILGLSPGTAVVCGGGDGPCSALGAGSIRDGETFLCFGTSAWIAQTSDDVFLDQGRKLICFGHVLPGKCLPCGTMQAAGSSYEYVRKLFFGDQKTVNGRSVYKEMERQILQSPPGADGLIFLPYLLGERSPRWNPDASGCFLGIRPEHGRGDYIRAVLEGIAMNLRIILSAQSEKGKVSELTLTGGGARGDVTAQILADVLGVRLNRLDNVEVATSVAAAVIAGVGAGVFPDFAVVGRFVKTEKVFAPDPSLQGLYDREQELFEEGYQGLRGYYRMNRDKQ